MRTNDWSPFWGYLCVLAAVAVLLQACAPLSGPREDLPPLNPQQIWARFEQEAALRGDVPFWLKASLNYSGPEDSHRSQFELWGNTELPLRLDLKASLGIIVSLWRIDANGWLIYVPEEKTAYTHPEAALALQRLDFPCPLNMQDLARIFTGQAAACMPSSYTKATATTDQNIQYRFASWSRIRTLVLDSKGRISSMSGHQPYTWSLEMDDYKKAKQAAFARTYRLRTAQGHKAVVRIKEIRLRSAPWPKKALSLPLPEGTARRHLGE